jgi:CheY-like chemotaxis protein
MAKKILIVDDDPNIINYLTDIFGDNGYETCSANGGREALEVARREKPDLITLDLEMPEEWGPRFFRRMSQDKEIMNTPVIVISGLSGNKYAIQKAVASISKPFDRDELLRLVKDAIVDAD